MSENPSAPQDQPPWRPDSGPAGPAGPQGQYQQGQQPGQQPQPYASQPYSSQQGYSAAPAYQPEAAPAYSPYGQQQYGGREHPKGTLVFVLGLLSVLGLTILAPFAWVMGRRALREIDSNRSAYSNRGMVVAGYVMGIIGTVLLALFAVLLVIGITAAILSSGSPSPTR